MSKQLKHLVPIFALAAALIPALAQTNDELNAKIMALSELDHKIAADPNLLPRAKAGDATAQVLVGGLYETGMTFPRDLAKAADWYGKAAAQGDAEAEFKLGCLYYGGRGVPKDNVKAAAWYRKAAEQGHAQAQLFLGESYVHGEGVPKNNVLAANWIRKAADQDDAGGQFDLGLLYERGQGVAKGFCPGGRLVW